MPGVIHGVEASNMHEYQAFIVRYCVFSYGKAANVALWGKRGTIGMVSGPVGLGMIGRSVRAVRGALGMNAMGDSF
jgi:hypothetical protein